MRRRPTRRAHPGRAGRPAAGLASIAMLVAALLVAALPVGAKEGEAPEAPPARAAAPLPDTWYAQALAYSDAGINVTHFWSKGKKLRAETVIAGHRVVTIVNGDTYFAYDSLSREGVAIARTAAALEQERARSRPFGNELEALLRRGAERIGAEKIGGREVDLYQITDDGGRRQVWVTTDGRQLPIRLKVWRRHTGQTLHTDFLSWTRGLPIGDSFFDPEPSVTLERMGFEEYVSRQGNRTPTGPVPVLYTDLLHGY
ncbi:MAG: DUF2092 domain-containing protein [Myxococcota bacterium]|nr:DUF2092 domain-containing protein [Myxococcota bacterium]